MHIEDQTSAVQGQVYAVIRQAADSGIQLTTMDFSLDQTGSPVIDGMDPMDWLNAMTAR